MVSLSCGQYRGAGGEPVHKARDADAQDRHSQLGKKQWLCWVHLLCGRHSVSLQPWPGHTHAIPVHCWVTCSGRGLKGVCIL